MAQRYLPLNERTLALLRGQYEDAKRSEALFNQTVGHLLAFAGLAPSPGTSVNVDFDQGRLVYESAEEDTPPAEEANAAEPLVGRRKARA